MSWSPAPEGWTLVTEARPSSGGSVGQSPVMSVYPDGTEITLQATPAAGSAFSYWMINGVNVGSANPYTFAIRDTTAASAFFSSWTPAPEGWTLVTEVRPDASGSVGVSPVMSAYPDGTEVTLQASPASGYTLSYWMINGVNVGATNPYTFAIRDTTAASAFFVFTTGSPQQLVRGLAAGVGVNVRLARTITATTPPAGVTATLNKLATDLSGVPISTVQPGEVFRYVLEVGTSQAWVFRGITVRDQFPDGVSGVAIESITGGIATITAQGLTANMDPPGSELWSLVLRMLASTALAPDTTLTNTATADINSGRVDASVALTVSGAAVTDPPPPLAPSGWPVLVGISPVGGGALAVTPTTPTVAHGATLTLTATPNAGYTFLRWVVNGVAVATTPSASLTVTSPVVATAVLERSGYTLTTSASPANSGTVLISPSQQVYSHGINVTLTAQSFTGYELSHWLVDGVTAGGANPLTLTMTANHTVQAVFALAGPELLVRGLAVARPIVASLRRVVTVDPTQLTVGISALRVSGTGVIYVQPGQQFYYLIRVDNPDAAVGGASIPTVTLVATFPPEIRPVQVANTTGGLATLNGQTLSGALQPYAGAPASVMVLVYLAPTVASGARVTVTASALAAGGVTAQAQTSVIAQGAVVPGPYPAPQTQGHTVSVVVSPGSQAGVASISPPASGFALNSPISVTATPAAGYTFQRWVVNGQDAGSLPTLSLSVTGDMTISAVMVAADPELEPGQDVEPEPPSIPTPGPVPNPNDSFRFGGGRYRPVIDAWQVYTPVPVSGSMGEWTHVPYGGNVFETDGSSLHTTWTVRVQIMDSEDYRLFRINWHKFADLTAPAEIFTGTKRARLSNWSNMQFQPRNGSWIGEVVFEWDE